MTTFGDDSLPPTMRLVGVRGEQIPLFTRYVDPGPSFIGVSKGAKGLDAPDFDIQVDAFPTIDGRFIRAVRAEGREILLPIVIYGNSRRDMILKKRALLSALNPKIGTVSLVTAESLAPLSGPTDTGAYEDERTIELYYSHGFEGDEGRTVSGFNWIKVGLVLRATYPFFQATDTLRFPFAFAASPPVSFFAPPTTPYPGTAWVDRVFRLSQEAPFNPKITFNNPGDAQDYPSFRIIGPISGPFDLIWRSSDGFSDRALSISDEFTLAVGQQAIITTTPGAQGISSTTDLGFEVFGTNPNFWTLEPGLNTVEIVATGGQTLNPTYMEIFFKPNYMGL